MSPDGGILRSVVRGEILLPVSRVFHQHDGGSEEEEEGDEEEEEMEESEEGEEDEMGEEDEGEGAGRPAPTRPTGANRKQRRYKLRKREVTRRQVFNVTAEEPLPRKVRLGGFPGRSTSKRAFLETVSVFPLRCFFPPDGYGEVRWTWRASVVSVIVVSTIIVAAVL